MSPERINELLAEVIEQARALGIPVSEDIVPEVRLNRRATGRFGCCIRRAGIYTIELSERLLKARETAVRQTLAHEVLHTCRGCANHGARWKSYAARMNEAYGYAIARTDTCEKLGVEDTVQARYLVVCTRCGAQFRRSRKSRRWRKAGCSWRRTKKHWRKSVRNPTSCSGSWKSSRRNMNA